MTAAVILAAGASTRLGQPKQLTTIKGETLLERTVRIARDAGFSPIIVVLGAHASLINIQCRLVEAHVIENKHWSQGMASSIHAGLAACPQADGVLLMTCDQPAVTTNHLCSLVATGAVTASAYAGRRGVPAFFPATSFPDLLKLAGDTGARELLRSAPTIDLPNGDLDIDTPEDLAHARKLLG